MTAADPDADAGPDTAQEQPVGYAAAMAELEGILAELEDEDLDVDLLATRVERAAALIRLCRNRIRQAQLKVEQVVVELESLDPVVPDGG